MCIHSHESTDWHKTTTWQGYPSVDHGGMQIDVGTWASYTTGSWARWSRGFPPDPAQASPFVQLVVAYRIWKDDGWARPWPNTSIECGLA